MKLQAKQRLLAADASDDFKKAIEEVKRLKNPYPLLKYLKVKSRHQGGDLAYFSFSVEAKLVPLLEAHGFIVKNKGHGVWTARNGSIKLFAKPDTSNRGMLIYYMD